MSSLLIVDDAVLLAELLAEHLTGVGYDVSVINDPELACRAANDGFGGTPPDIALVDLSFPRHEVNGTDVMMAFTTSGVATSLIVYTQGDWRVGDQLALIWDAFTPASGVSKLSPVDRLLATIDEVDRHGTAEVDPLLRSYIPDQRSPWRTIEGYRRLVPHAGHAKMWRALLNAPKPPSYKEIAKVTGLSVNTLRNYRDDLLGELGLHGLTSPRMREMHEFVHGARPFLAPIIEEKLDS